MKLLVRMAGMFAPPPLRKKELKNLFRVTASALGTSPPDNSGRSFRDSLGEYARFTRSEIERLLSAGGDMEGVRDRLFQGGLKEGARIRRLCVIRTADDAVVAMKVLYQMLGIEAHSNGETVITVSRCSFSGVYSADICGVVSALDDGIFAGLSNGRRLSFYRRITQGCPSCAATISPGDTDE